MAHKRPPLPHDHLPDAPPLTVTSDDVGHEGTFPDACLANIMGMTGDNLSPHLRWEGAPPETQSYAVTCFDPDAPTGSGFWHWVVYNIPASTTTLPAGAGDPKGHALPSGATQGNTDMAQPGYLGPCPPQGDKPHRYIFTVYALKTAKLELPANATAAMVGFNVHGNQLAKATLTAKWGR